MQAASIAPVFPAETTASALPSPTERQADRRPHPAFLRAMRLINQKRDPQVLELRIGLQLFEHPCGEADRIVRFAGQERTMTQIRKLNGCDDDGKPAGKWCTEYRSTSGPPVITFIHPGGHEIPDGAPERIVEFFKGQKRKE